MHNSIMIELKKVSVICLPFITAEVIKPFIYKSKPCRTSRKQCSKWLVAWPVYLLLHQRNKS